ncbi:MAG: hypothetical protein NTY19_06625, partial [Planctomycetota bacterium]|nr:hypothetical protein [Planctomycetota bacterium]
MGTFSRLLDRRKALARRRRTGRILFHQQLEPRTLLAALVQYDFTGASGDQEFTYPTPAYVDPNITVSCQPGVDATGCVQRGPGVTPAVSSNSMNSVDWTTNTTLDLSDYYSFGTWTPKSSMTLTQLHFGYEKSTWGPRKFAIRSSLDNFTTNVISNVLYAGVSSYDVNLLNQGSKFVDLTNSVEFRLYAFWSVDSAGELRLINSTTVSPYGLFVEGTTPSLPGFTLSKATATVSEPNTTDTFTVVLSKQPLTDVVFSVTSSDTGEVTAAPSTLTFTSANWNTAQTVTLTAADDMTVDGPQTSTVTVAVVDASSDNAWDPLADK